MASSRLQSYKCDIQGNTCSGPYFLGSTDGVYTVTSIVNGVGQTGGSSSLSSGTSGSSSAAAATGSSKPNGAAASAVVGDNAGFLIMAAIGCALWL